MARTIIESKRQNSSKTMSRALPILPEKGKREYRAKKFESKGRYGVLRSKPRIVELI